MQNSIENNKNGDKKNLRMFTQHALKSGIRAEEVAIANRRIKAEEKSEIQEELIIH